MNTFEEITAAIGRLSPEEQAEVQVWLIERD
jgi:hypothetical protein